MNFIQAYPESDDDDLLEIETDTGGVYPKGILTCQNDEQEGDKDDQLDNDDLMIQTAIHLLGANKWDKAAGDHCDEDCDFVTTTTETDEDSDFDTDNSIVQETRAGITETEMDSDDSTVLTNTKTKMVTENGEATAFRMSTTTTKTDGNDDDFLLLPPGDQEEGLYDMATLIDDVALERERLYAICPIKFKDEDDKSRRCKPFPYAASKGVLSELKHHGYNTWVSQSVKTSVSTLIEQTGQFIVYCQGQLKNKDKTR